MKLNSFSEPTEICKISKEYFYLNPIDKADFLSLLESWINIEKSKLQDSKFLN